MRDILYRTSSSSSGGPFFNTASTLSPHTGFWTDQVTDNSEGLSTKFSVSEADPGQRQEKGATRAMSHFTTSIRLQFLGAVFSLLASLATGVAGQFFAHPFIGTASVCLMLIGFVLLSRVKSEASNAMEGTHQL